MLAAIKGLMARNRQPKVRFKHRVEYLLFRSLVCVMQMLSPRATRATARGLAFIVHRCLPRRWTRYGVARENLEHAFGGRLSEAQIDETIGRMWVHLFRVVAEITQLPRKLHLSSLREVVHFRDRERVVRAMCSGRPVILLSGHFGNWEAAVSVFGLFGFPMGVVARELDNPLLDAWFRRFRQHTGHRMIDKKGGAETMLAMLEARGHLAMLGDQDAGRRGLYVDFFGRPASTFKSIALLAVQYRALICVGYARRLPDDFENHPWVRYELGCEEVIDPEAIDESDVLGEITRRYTHALERAIRRAPEQYFWVHRRWKHQPTERQLKRMRAA
jgi:KDO2-lipid IV(A) lauroyltransferase